MRLEKIRYRSSQFRQALLSVPDPDDLTLAQTWLSTAQKELFSRLQESEQAHSLQIFKRLLDQCRLEPVDSQDDLLLAALLHDVGKSCFPLSIWDRVLIVLAKAIFPNRIREWGRLPEANSFSSPGVQMRGWRRAFVIAEQHPRWGAEMAAAAGASPLAVSLIRRHQEASRQSVQSLEDRLLCRLQAADGSF
jgi:exopolyphosphatase/pppGpp-phosphohydrolase